MVLLSRPCLLADARPRPWSLSKTLPHPVRAPVPPPPPDTPLPHSALASGKDVSSLVLLCILILGGARPLALYTPHVGVVYACYVPMVVALGVMNTAITTTASRLADKDQLGGFFGLLESVENVAGMMGPAAGGLLASVDGVPATLIAVVGLYALAFALVALFFPTYCRADQGKGAAATAGGANGLGARTAVATLSAQPDAEKKAA